MRLSDVNTTDIRSAIELGCGTMQSVFNADDNDIPFFGSVVRPKAEMSFSWAHSEAHVPGRHLNALLNARDACGIDVSESAIDRHASAAYFSYSGAVPLPLNRQEITGPLVNFLAHNLREGFHALYALAAFRKDERALELIGQSIDAIWRYWDPVKRWQKERLANEHGLTVNDGGTFIIGEARAIGPLVKIHRATGYKPALDLAIAMKDKCLAEFYTADGSYDRERFGTHVHSTTCVLSSLAQLADLLDDAPLLERVPAFYNNGLWQIRDEIGWSIENSGDKANPDFGESNNTGDILETALILGRRGHAQCYDDAERILRCHLLPSQLRDVSFIQNPPNPNRRDGLRDVANRHRGAFGFPAPYGHQTVGSDFVSFNMDIVGGAVGSLCEAYREIVRSDASGHHVNMLFDHRTKCVEVESPYTHDALRIRVMRPGPLSIRMPRWVNPRDAMVSVAHEWKGAHVVIAHPPLDEFITVRFPLNAFPLTLHHRTRDIRVELRGDSVTAMQNFGADLTYFPPCDA